MLRFCAHSELSCKSLEGQEGLRQLIYQVTCHMKDVGSTIGCQRLAGRLVGIPWKWGGWWAPLTPGGQKGPLSACRGVCTSLFPLP